MEDYPQGFRFFPTEEELLCFYLKHKLQGDREDIDAVIPVVNIYHHCPWHLPQLAGELCRGDPEQCFFFVDMQENISRGGKPNRLTTEGYWKAAGTPTLIYSSSSSSNNEIIGGKRTMVFYRGRAPRGRKTQWKMIEYRAIHGEPSPTATISDVQLRHEFSLCRIYKKARLDRGFDRRPSAPAAIAVPPAIVESSSSHLQTFPATISFPEAIAQSSFSHLHTIPEAVAESSFSHLQTVPEAIAESSSSLYLQTVPEAMAELSSSYLQVVPEAVAESSSQNMVCDDFWDVCVPLWDWEQSTGF